jgi:hypothetical protein
MHSVVVLILDNTLKVSPVYSSIIVAPKCQSIPTQPVLNAPEVDTLFSHPLASFLSTTFPERAEPRGPFLEAEAHAETAAVELQYHTYSDVPGPPRSNHPSPSTRNTDSAGSAAEGHVVRMHRFLTGREAGGIKPIYGLTACVLFFPPQYYSAPILTYAPRQCDPHSHRGYRVRSSTGLSRTGAWRTRDQRACGLVVASPRKETRRGYAEGAFRR